MSSTTIPGWVRDLVREHRGSDPWFITTKSVKISDLDRNQNRFLISSRDVEDNLVPMLSEAEKAEASLLHCTSRRNMPTIGRVRGRDHKGLEVCVYPRSRFRTHLRLTRWDSSTGSAVIKGDEYKYFLDRSSLRENDEVELWGFRKGEEGKLCFALGKKTQ